MQIQLPDFGDLPKPLKLGFLLITGGFGLTGIVAILFGRTVGLIILTGLFVLGLIFALYVGVLNYLRKLRQRPMEQQLRQNIAAAPVSVSDPMRRAMLDDLRRKFEEGVSKFKAAGKSLYDFPWYMVVGEPGSGKTEAIRHSNVGFPPGLHDELQGAGGTINMNWWFTADAVILDTAGKLMFEEVEAGGNSEWQEFLKLLKKNRNNCPINGVILVIPADSLIRDTIDEIERKASKISKQFNTIQQILDVRFPVFVVISKADLILGFRDFFENIKDPRLQHQILGWSNPAPLDEPYNPSFVEQYITAVRKSLLRRRLGLMQQIAAAGTPELETRRPDVLFAFPENLAKLAPRLTRYLEIIFSVGNRWAYKPVFFRGIYFTSSMREGSALDMELAEALGLTVADMDDGRVWTKNRAFFLRDVFKKKIFSEAGLVTRATNAKKKYTQQRALVYGSALIGVLLMLFFTVYFNQQWKKNIGQLEQYFDYAAKNSKSHELHIVKNSKYDGNSETFKNIPLYKYFSGLANEVKENRTPWIFMPAVRLSGSPNLAKMREAAAKVYEENVLLPMIDAGVKNINPQNKQIEIGWDSPQDKKSPRDVLYNLVALQAGRVFESNRTYSKSDFLNPFFYSFAGEGSSQVYSAHKADLHFPLNSLYDRSALPWPPKDVREKTSKICLELANRFVEDAKSGAAIRSDVYDLKEKLSSYQDKEKILLAVTRDNNSDYLKQWETAYYTLKTAYDQAVKEKGSFLKLTEFDPKSDNKKISDWFDQLLALLESENNPAPELKKILQEGKEAAIQGIDNASQKMKELYAQFCREEDGKTILEVRYALYSTAIESIENKDTAISFLKTKDKLDALDKGIKQKDAYASALNVVLACTEKNCPKDIDSVKTLVADEAIETPFKRLDSKTQYNSVFHPGAAAKVFSQWEKIYGLKEFTWAQKENIKQNVFDAYFIEFWNYWLEEFPKTYIGIMMGDDIQTHLKDDYASVEGKLDNLRNEIALINGRFRCFAEKKQDQEVDKAVRYLISIKLGEINAFYNRWKHLMDYLPDNADSVLSKKNDLFKKNREQLKSEYFDNLQAYQKGQIDILYKRLLAEKCVKKLALDAQAAHKKMLDIFEGYRKKFPLNARTDSELSIEEYRVLKTYFSNVIDSVSINDTKIDADLAQIAGSSRPDWFDSVNQKLEKLPDPDKPYSCKIYLAENPQTAELSKYYTGITGSCGDVKNGCENGDLKFNQTAEVLLAIKCPEKNHEIKIDCVRRVSKETFSIQFSSPWAGLRMLAKCFKNATQIVFEQFMPIIGQDDNPLSLRLRMEIIDDSQKNYTEQLWNMLKSE